MSAAKTIFSESSDEIHARPSLRGASPKTFCATTCETSPHCSRVPMSSSRSIATAVCPSAPFLVPRRACAIFRNVQPTLCPVAAKHDAAHPRPGRAQTQSSFLRKVKSKQGRFAPPPKLDEDSGEVCAQPSRTRSRANCMHSFFRPSDYYVSTKTSKALFACIRVCLGTLLLPTMIPST